MIFEPTVDVLEQVPFKKQIKIKLEIDILPPSDFNTEIKYLLQPIPFSIRTYKLPYLFAGKMYALLFRKWKTRVKGRDWYDFVWFLSNYPQINLFHLKQRMIQTKNWDLKKSFNKEDLLQLLIKSIDSLDIDQVKKDVEPFINDPRTIEIWSKDFFLNILSRIKFL